MHKKANDQCSGCHWAGDAGLGPNPGEVVGPDCVMDVDILERLFRAYSATPAITAAARIASRTKPVVDVRKPRSENGVGSG